MICIPALATTQPISGKRVNFWLTPLCCASSRRGAHRLESGWKFSLRERQTKQAVKVTASDGSDRTDLIVIDELHFVPGGPGAVSEQATQYRLGDAIELIGYDVPRVDANQPSVTYRLYWRAMKDGAQDYTVFAHLLDQSGAQIGLGDSQPFNGDYPTSAWRAGETAVEERAVTLTTGTIPENATLAIGLYRLADGTRLPVIDGAGQRVLNDEILLPVQP